MRITGGKLRSRKLKTLKGDNTRPTADKIKGAIYSSIAFDVNYNIMLDLFAGSGAMGIEALSRGFKFSYFNDNNKKAANIIKSNLKDLDLLKSSKVFSVDYKDCLRLVSKENKIDFIFIDPPYDQIEISEIFYLIDKYDILTKTGIVCVETANTQVLAKKYENLIKYKEKNYKATNVAYFRKEE